MIVKRILVMTTDTPPDFTTTGRQLAQRDAKFGYGLPGYHYVIRRSGVLDPGRSPRTPSPYPEAEEGDLVVVVVGTEDNQTEDQKKQLAALHLAVRENHGGQVTVEWY